MGQSHLCNTSPPVDDGCDNVDLHVVKSRSALSCVSIYPHFSSCGALCAGTGTTNTKCAQYSVLCGGDVNGGQAADVGVVVVGTEHVAVAQECCVQTHRFDKKEPTNKVSSWRVLDTPLDTRLPDDADDTRAQCGGLGPMTMARSRLGAPHAKHRFHDCYVMSAKLGEGSFGDVFEAVPKSHVDPFTPVRPFSQPQQNTAAGLQQSASSTGSRRPTTSPRVAVKVFSFTKGDQAGEKKERWSAQAERAILATLEHPNIVKMIECFEEDDKFYIVLEQCYGGELYARMVRTTQQGRPGEDEDTARVIFRQMLRAVSYLHAKSITHRDLKTENFLLLGKPGSPEENILKLCDFGAAVRLRQNERSMEKVGTLSYTAPEVYMNRGADSASDVWALGVVLYVVLTGTNPFRLPEHTREETVRCIQIGRFDTRRQSWARTSEAAKDLIRKLLVLNETERLTTSEALKHPWVTFEMAKIHQQMRLEQIGPSSAIHARYGSRVVQLMTRLRRLDHLQKTLLVSAARATSELSLVYLKNTVPWCQIFIALDIDEDGVLSCSEFVQGLHSVLGLDESTVPFVHPRLLWCALDVDGSNRVDWAEWLMLALLDVDGALEAPHLLSTTFRLLDRPSSDGILSVDDLQRFLLPVSPNDGGSRSFSRGEKGDDTDAAGCVIGSGDASGGVGSSPQAVPAAARLAATHALKTWMPGASRIPSTEGASRIRSSTEDRSPICCFCEEQLASKRCEDCSANICEACHSSTHSKSTCRSHRLTQIEGMPLVRSVGDGEPSSTEDAGAERRASDQPPPQRNLLLGRAEAALHAKPTLTISDVRRCLQAARYVAQ